MVDRMKFADKRRPPDLEGLAEVVTWEQFDENWKYNALPESSATDELSFALEILYGNGPRAMAVKFLDRCIAVDERVRAENFLDQPRFEPFRNCKEAFLAAVVNYARWMKGEPLNQSALLGSAGLLEKQWTAKKDWQDEGEAHWLKAVRLCMIGGDEDRAKRLNATKHKFLYHGEERQALQAVLDDANAGKRHFQKMFDFIRDPACKLGHLREPVTHEFELGCIWVKYYEGGLDDWQKVIRAVAE